MTPLLLFFLYLLVGIAVQVTAHWQNRPIPSRGAGLVLRRRLVRYGPP